MKKSIKKEDKNKQNVDFAALGFQIRESYKKARTNITYSVVKKGCKEIAFTSSRKGEGKTLTATNVAIALAQQVDTKVLIVECDLRRPRVHGALNINPAPGITNYLNFECSEQDIVKKTKIENLEAICYGAIPPNPSELLASNTMMELIDKMAERYDYIIFDTPPIGVVIDALPIIKHADGVVVVVRNNTSTFPEFNKTIDALKRSETKILGVIFNEVDSISTKKYGKGYSYGYYGYYGY